MQRAPRAVRVGCLGAVVTSLTFVVGLTIAANAESRKPADAPPLGVSSDWWLLPIFAALALVVFLIVLALGVIVWIVRRFSGAPHRPT